MVKFAQVILRGSQFIWTLFITALIGNVIAEAFAGNPSSINYAIFVAVFSWISLLLGLVAAFMDMENPILIGLDAFAAGFTFIAGVVLAAKLGVHSCGNVVSAFLRCAFLSLSNSLAVIHNDQQLNQRIAQHVKAMSRAPSQHRILLVPVCFFHRVSRRWYNEWRKLDVHEKARYRSQRSVHVPGVIGYGKQSFAICDLTAYYVAQTWSYN
jgi:fucose 4-O-acetylase-like acetyltransferase